MNISKQLSRLYRDPTPRNRNALSVFVRVSGPCRLLNTRGGFMAGKTREGHLERTAAEPRDEMLRETTVARVDQVNDGIRLFRLALKEPVQFLSGQWLDTFVPNTPKPGGFTITSAPSSAANETSPYLELAVQDSPQNATAAWLWRPAEQILGEMVRVRVGGSFVFPPALNGAVAEKDGRGNGRRQNGGLEGIERIVLVAGGVGVNPLMSILSHLADSHKDHNLSISILYSTKLPSTGLKSILFLDRITTLLSTREINAQLQLYLTRSPQQTEAEQSSPDSVNVEQGSHRINGTDVQVYTRRLTMKDLEGVVGGQDGSKSLVYVCGPPGMTDEFVHGVRGVGVEAGRVLFEKWW